MRGPAPNLVACGLMCAVFAASLADAQHALAAIAGAAAGMQAVLAWRAWRGR